jgi:hypothetical protein
LYETERQKKETVFPLILQALWLAMGLWLLACEKRNIQKEMQEVKWGWETCLHKTSSKNIWKASEVQIVASANSFIPKTLPASHRYQETNMSKQMEETFLKTQGLLAVVDDKETVQKTLLETERQEKICMFENLETELLHPPHLYKIFGPQKKILEKMPQPPQGKKEKMCMEMASTLW